MTLPYGGVDSQGPTAFLLGPNRKQYVVPCRKTMLTFPSEAEALFCPNGTNKDNLKKLPWSNPGRRERIES